MHIHYYQHFCPFWFTCGTVYLAFKLTSLSLHTSKWKRIEELNFRTQEAGGELSATLVYCSFLSYWHTCSLWWQCWRTADKHLADGMWAGCKDASPWTSCWQYVNTPADWPCRVFQKPLWPDLRKQQHSSETFTIVRLVFRSWWKFIVLHIQTEIWSLQCLPLFGMPRSWDAGLCIMPGKQK